MIWPAPTIRAPCRAARPTPPQPMMATLAPAGMSTVFSAAPRPVVTPQQHGAVADGKANDTLAVRAAAAACDGCTLLFANGSFLTGPFTLRDGSDVVVEGTIVAAPMAWWVPAGWGGVGEFISASGAEHGLTLRGPPNSVARCVEILRGHWRAVRVVVALSLLSLLATALAIVWM